MLLLAAAAMVGTLPGRTQGLGLVTEPLIAELGIGRVEYAQLNLWATLIGAVFAIGIGRFIDRLGTRVVLTIVALSLGAVVVMMSGVQSFWALAVAVTLTRGLGQSALSVISLAMVGQWFVRRIDLAMAIYSIVMSIGFMIAFPVVGSIVQSSGWRSAWLMIGVALIVVLAPMSWIILRRSPESPSGVSTTFADGATWQEALSTPAFWLFAIGAALYGLVASGIGLFNESILAERGFGPNVYYQTLVVTALTALAGNFGGGWLAMRMSLPTLLSISLVRARARTRGAAARDHDRARDAVGHRHGARRRPGDGAVLQRLAARVWTQTPRQHSRRRAGDDRGRVGGWSVAARLVRRSHRQLQRDVQRARGGDRRHGVLGADDTVAACCRQYVEPGSAVLHLTS